MFQSLSFQQCPVSFTTACCRTVCGRWYLLPCSLPFASQNQNCLDVRCENHALQVLLLWLRQANATSPGFATLLPTRPCKLSKLGTAKWGIMVDCGGMVWPGDILVKFFCRFGMATILQLLTRARRNALVSCNSSLVLGGSVQYMCKESVHFTPCLSRPFFGKVAFELLSVFTVWCTYSVLWLWFFNSLFWPVGQIFFRSLWHVFIVFTPVFFWRSIAFALIWC